MWESYMERFVVWVNNANDAPYMLLLGAHLQCGRYENDAPTILPGNSTYGACLQHIEKSMVYTPHFAKIS